MTYLVMVFSLLCGSVIQAVLPSWDWMGQSQLPVLLCIVLYYALNYDTGSLLIAGLLGGLFQDALGMTPLGYSSFCFCLVGLVAARFKGMVFIHQGLTHMIMGALAGAGVMLCMSLLFTIDGKLVFPFWFLFLKVAGSSLMATIAFPVEFRLLESIDTFLGNIQVKEE